jgi:Spy/CpxP family protein refolding chaperone
VTFVYTQQCHSNEELKKNIFDVKKTLVLDEKILPHSILVRLYIEEIMDNFQGKTLYRQIFDDNSGDKAKTILKLASISENQQEEITLLINKLLDRSALIRASMTKLNFYGRKLKNLYEGDNRNQLTKKELNIIENNYVNLQRTLNNIGSEAFLTILSDEQIQTVRECMLASPSAMEFNITEDDELIVHKEIETINFDSFKSLDLTKKQQNQIETIYKNFEPKLFTLMKILYSYDKEKVAESINKLDDLILQTKTHILNILTDKQKSKLEKLKEIKL